MFFQVVRSRFAGEWIITNVVSSHGPNIKPLGEMKNEEQLYQKQIAQTIASLLGENFQSNKPVAPAIALK